MKVGYARISRGDHQELTSQIRALTEAGCEKIYEEKASGGRDVYRPQLRALLYGLKAGDELIVWKVDRLSRSVSDLLLTVNQIEVVGATFRSLTEPIDTSSAGGRMMMQMIGSFAEFEREMIRERTLKGLETARLRGKKPGRRPSLSTSQKAEIIRMLGEGRATTGHAAALFRVSRATIKRAVAEYRVQLMADRTLGEFAPRRGGRPKKAAAPDPFGALFQTPPLVPTLDEARARAAWNECVPVEGALFDPEEQDARRALRVCGAAETDS